MIQGLLYVGCRLLVDDVVSRREAARRLGTTDLWDATDFVLVKKAEPFLPDRAVPRSVAERLRFVPDRPLKFKRPGVLDQQTLRGVRELTAVSARLLDSVLNANSDSAWRSGIPNGITRGDLLEAMARLDGGDRHEFGESRKFDVLYRGRRYPPKAVVGLAARRLVGRDLVPSDFSGGLESKCLRVLEDAGFDVVGKDGELVEESDEDRAESVVWQRTDIRPTQKETLVLARRGQGAYRRNLERIEKACRLTGCRDLKHLRASHIKPWKDSSDAEKLDGNNGLLLAPHVDHLFDGGWISFEDDGTLKVARHLDRAVLEQWGLSASANAGAFSKEQRRYLKYHRERVFERRSREIEKQAGEPP